MATCRGCLDVRYTHSADCKRQGTARATPPEAPPVPVAPVVLPARSGAEVAPAPPSTPAGLVEQARAALEGVSEGKWETTGSLGGLAYEVYAVGGDPVSPVVLRWPDARFIAAARQLVPRLAAALERAEARLAAAERVVDAARAWTDAYEAEDAEALPDANVRLRLAAAVRAHDRDGAA